MEQEVARSAAGRSKFITAMGWMRRTGMLYIIAAMMMASCKSCNCVSAGCSIPALNQFICHIWRVVTGCNEVCVIRLQLVDKNGNKLTNVRSSSFARVKIHNSNNVNDVYFSGRINFDANGLSPELRLNRCVNPCSLDFSKLPFGIALGGFDILTTGYGCPPGFCRFWDLPGSGSSITPTYGGNCVITFKIQLAQGDCEPC